MIIKMFAFDHTMIKINKSFFFNLELDFRLNFELGNLRKLVKKT